MRRWLLVWIAFSATTLLAQAPITLPYSVVYVREPRLGDQTEVPMPEVMNAVRLAPGTDLMLLKPDGSEEVLFAGGNGGVMDPAMSFDARTVFFSYCSDLRPQALNSQRNDAPRAGFDIYKLDLQTRQVTRLTEQRYDPPSGAVPWSSELLTANPVGSYYPGYGVFNVGPYPLPGNRLVFSSSRENYLPNKAFAFPNLRLYTMDQDGKNIEAIGHLNIGSALHPTVLKDGRIMFASWEAEANRDERSWGLWAMRPDGTEWEPLKSAFDLASAFHFQTQLTDGRVGVIDYYNLNNFGYGSLLAFELANLPSGAMHGSALPEDLSNPLVRRGVWWFDASHPQHKLARYKSYRFSPRNLLALTAFTHGEDEAASYDPDAPDSAPVFAGKVSHPSGAPNNDVLLSYSGGPVNRLNRPTNRPVPDAGLYLLSAGLPINNHKQLRLIKNSANYNEMMPRAVVSYLSIYGVAEPTRLAPLKNDGSLHVALPAATPFGIVGSSSFYRRDTKPGAFANQVNRWDGLDPFNTAENEQNPNWFTQGADAGKYLDSDIFAVRILAMEGVANKSYGPMSAVVGFKQHGKQERYRILGEIPLRKKNAQGQTILDSDGNPDTSFHAKIPADLSFTFQTLDKDGLVLNFSQTWHQLRPGETRTNCGGCHAHAQAPLSFQNTAAGRNDPSAPLASMGVFTQLLSKNQAGETITRIENVREVSYEFNRDIKPILQRSCATGGCHSGSNPAALLRLDDNSIVREVSNTYNRLADDPTAIYGYRSMINTGQWRQTNQSRYIRAFQSRRSLMMWKIFGRRLDGWANSQFPTETTPGDFNTFPAGANRNDADIDYTGQIMPPPNSGVPALSEDEKMMIARWIDLGAPVDAANAAQAALGWFHDEQKPTLTLPWPAIGSNAPASLIRVGAYDLDTGIDWSTLSVKCSIALANRPAESELADSFVGDEYSRTLSLPTPLQNLSNVRLTVHIKDLQGNGSTIERVFSVRAVDEILRNGFED